MTITDVRCGFSKDNPNILHHIIIEPMLNCKFLYGFVINVEYAYIQHRTGQNLIP